MCLHCHLPALALYGFVLRPSWLPCSLSQKKAEYGSCAYRLAATVEERVWQANQAKKRDTDKQKRKRGETFHTRLKIYLELNLRSTSSRHQQSRRYPHICKSANHPLPAHDHAAVSPHERLETVERLSRPRQGPERSKDARTEPSVKSDCGTVA
mmetsp:Transcript_670/g.1489  ORF Transcript_670/g.1489 Transcript_670/m.1489 type:complete len:154 (+) Transcript_670:122-583(+)